MPDRMKSKIKSGVRWHLERLEATPIRIGILFCGLCGVLESIGLQSRRTIPAVKHINNSGILMPYTTVCAPLSSVAVEQWGDT